MKARAEMVECPGCRTRINPDDLACGSDRCYRIAVAEAQL
jgi:predicted nucleic acid-binding Zn ribbon protein